MGHRSAPPHSVKYCLLLARSTRNFTHMDPNSQRSSHSQAQVQIGDNAARADIVSIDGPLSLFEDMISHPSLLPLYPISSSSTSSATHPKYPLHPGAVDHSLHMPSRALPLIPSTSGEQQLFDFNCLQTPAIQVDSNELDNLMTIESTLELDGIVPPPQQQWPIGQHCARPPFPPYSQVLQQMHLLQMRQLELLQTQQNLAHQMALWTHHQVLPQPVTAEVEMNTSISGGPEDAESRSHSNAMAASHSPQNQILQSQSMDSRQQIVDLWFSPTPASSLLSETVSSSENIMGNREQGQQEYSPSAPNTDTECTAPAALRQKGTKVDCPAEAKIDGQAKVKRPRKALSLEERLEIIEFWEENRKAPMAGISKHFGVPRSTVYGIIKNRDTLKRPPKSQRYKGMDL
ncbi:hypothetical protein B0O80DRAFT_6146 [Mortierella sp. GBAus27b]|nr:hypothetical protein B0O80DRAFT_6146 [Mortierella sp. GBAus27b]